MIYLNIQFHYLTLQLFRIGSNTVPCNISNLVRQNSIPIFDTYILVSKQYGIGNAKSFVIIFENGSFVTPFLMLWDNSDLVVTMSRSEGKASEP